MQLSLLFARDNGRPLPPWRVEEAGHAAGLAPHVREGALRELARMGLFHETPEGWVPRPTVSARGAPGAPAPRARPRDHERDRGPRYR